MRADGLVFVTDGRYRDQAADELAAAGVEADIEIGRTSEEQRDLLAKAAGGIGRLGLEAEHVSWAQQQRYDGDWFEAAELVATTGLVEALRERKDAGRGGPHRGGLRHGRRRPRRRAPPPGRRA